MKQDACQYYHLPDFMPVGALGLLCKCYHQAASSPLHWHFNAIKAKPCFIRWVSAPSTPLFRNYRNILRISICLACMGPPRVHSPGPEGRSLKNKIQKFSVQKVGGRHSVPVSEGRSWLALWNVIAEWAAQPGKVLEGASHFRHQPRQASDELPEKQGVPSLSNFRRENGK